MPFSSSVGKDLPLLEEISDLSILSVRDSSSGHEIEQAPVATGFQAHLFESKLDTLTNSMLKMWDSLARLARPHETLFEFICLTFGLSLAPRVFTKVLKPFVASIRNKGIRLVIYLDDMAIISSSRELSSQEAVIIVQILESLGFIINKEKSVLFPSQKIVFLGYVIDSVARTVSLPEEKLNKVKEQTLSLSRNPQCSIR